MKMNIAVIQENQKKFFRLEEQIRARLRVVQKIYSCFYPSDFYELPHWQSCQLIIAENEIRGRANAGLEFFQDFFKPGAGNKAYGLLYTWGTDDYSQLRIQIQALHQKSPRFLGMVFAQIGDYEKIFDAIRGVSRDKTFPIFDRPVRYNARGELLQEERREDLEKLIMLSQRTQERLSFLVQLLRYHLEYRTGVDFRQTLREFSEYREKLPERLYELVQDVQELINVIESRHYLRESIEMKAAQQDFLILSHLSHQNQARFSQLYNLKSFIDFCRLPITPRLPKRFQNGSLYLWQDFLKEYDNLFYSVSHVIETAHVVIKTTQSREYYGKSPALA